MDVSHFKATAIEFKFPLLVIIVNKVTQLKGPSSCLGRFFAIQDGFTFYARQLIIELHVNDDRIYKPDSLPRKLAVLSSFYHHSQESVFWGACCLRAGKITFYRARPCKIHMYGYVVKVTFKHPMHYSPGIRVEFAQGTDVGSYAEIAISTTTGVLLRDIHGHERITVSKHGFIHSSEVVPFI